jgi:hypothetical protein
MVAEKTELPAVLDGVTLVVDLCTLGDEALAAFLAAALDQVTTGFGGHTGTEAVLAFAGTLRWLIGPFHLFRLKKCLTFQKIHHPNRFAVRIKSPEEPVAGLSSRKTAGRAATISSPPEMSTGHLRRSLSLTPVARVVRFRIG